MVREIPLDPERFAANENLMKSGDRVWLRWSNRPIADPDGVVREFLAIGMEITEARRTERALAGVSRILSAALTSETEEDLGVACLAVAEEITQSRLGFIGEVDDCRLLDIAISDPGWDACAVADRAGHRRLPGNFAIRGLFGRVLVDGRNPVASEPAHHPDSIGLPPDMPRSQRFWASRSSAMGRPAARSPSRTGRGYTDAQGGLLEAVAPAMVEAFSRKRAEQELQRFAVVASHGLQEPLRSIVSVAKLLECLYQGAIDADADDCIGGIVDGGFRTQRLVRDLLQFSRVETTANPPVPIDAELVARGAIALLKGRSVPSAAPWRWTRCRRSWPTRPCSSKPLRTWSATRSSTGARRCRT